MVAQIEYSKSQIMSRAYKIPALKFKDQNLTSFARLIIFPPLLLGYKDSFVEEEFGRDANDKVDLLFHLHWNLTSCPPNARPL